LSLKSISNLGMCPGKTVLVLETFEVRSHLIIQNMERLFRISHVDQQASDLPLERDDATRVACLSEYGFNFFLIQSQGFLRILAIFMEFSQVIQCDGKSMSVIAALVDRNYAVKHFSSERRILTETIHRFDQKRGGSRSAAVVLSRVKDTERFRIRMHSSGQISLRAKNVSNAEILMSD
jgi:hypothetical protein